MYVNWVFGEFFGFSFVFSGNKLISCVVVLYSFLVYFIGCWDDWSCMEEIYGFICQKGMDFFLSLFLVVLFFVLGIEFFYFNGIFRLFQKLLCWYDVFLLCESCNVSLVYVFDFYIQVFFMQVV